MIEDADVGEYMSLDVCYVKDACECTTTKEANDPSNKLCMSTIGHRMLDGTKGFAPMMRIEATHYDPDPVSVPVKTGSKVHLLVDFITARARARQQLRFKPGTVGDGVSKIKSWVFVKDPLVFMNGAQWKHENTTNLWREAGHSSVS